MNNIATWKLGLLGLSFWIIHALDCVLRLGQPENLLWACNLASLFVGIGLLFRWGACNSIGVLWLVIGLLMWILDLLGDGEFIVTSFATHVGGLWVGLRGIRMLGISPGSWRLAAVAMAALQQLSRWVTLERDNVNLAFAVWPGWELFFPSYSVYWVCLMAFTTLIFFATERLCRRYLLPSSDSGRKGGEAEVSQLDDILNHLEMPPEGLVSWFGRLRAFCHRHGGKNQYGELLILLDQCDAVLQKRAAPTDASSRTS